MAASRNDKCQIKFDCPRQCQPVLNAQPSFSLVVHHLANISHNRGDTGLSVDHVHLIASSMLRHGFRARPLFGRAEIGPRGQPHDVPVLVEGGSSCLSAVQSLSHMREMCSGEPGFPRPSIKPTAVKWYCSLGNGHFTQAI